MSWSKNDWETVHQKNELIENTFQSTYEDGFFATLDGLDEAHQHRINTLARICQCSKALALVVDQMIIIYCGRNFGMKHPKRTTLSRNKRNVIALGHSGDEKSGACEIIRHKIFPDIFKQWTTAVGNMFVKLGQRMQRKNVNPNQTYEIKVR